MPHASLPLGTAAIAHHFPSADFQIALQSSEEVLIYDFAVRLRECSWRWQEAWGELGTELLPGAHPALAGELLGGLLWYHHGHPRGSSWQWLVSAVNNAQLGTEVGFC